MPSFPHLGSVTICEINRDLITAESLSDDRARETYGKLLGMVFSPVPFQSDQVLSQSPEHGAEQGGRTGDSVDRKGLVAALQGILGDELKRLFHPNHVNLLPEVDLQGVSWHQHKHILAFISGPNQVVVRDYEDSVIQSGMSLTNLHIFGICLIRELFIHYMGCCSRICKLIIVFFCSDGTFYLWETNTWTSEPWSSTSGFVTGATWDPDGRMILLAFSESSTLGSIHFASKPPSLDAHLLPVDLPEIISLTGSQGIEKIAWDASGERLAVSYKGGNELYQGLIAIYDARRTPLISTSLIGFIRGPGDNPKPIAFSFHDKFRQGPLLSVSVFDLKQLFASWFNRPSLHTEQKTVRFIRSKPVQSRNKVAELQAAYKGNEFPVFPYLS
ncbi:hypothetical protein L1049_008547 [Liquidambar formosana]|uniref:Aladin n=1 Tax=Liquidambar formosana TaxID=63359 RepID=A0AAP0X8C5_LIQFO